MYYFGMQHRDTALGPMVCMQPFREFPVRSEVQRFVTSLVDDNIFLLLLHKEKDIVSMQETCC